MFPEGKERFLGRFIAVSLPELLLGKANKGLRGARTDGVRVA